MITLDGVYTVGKSGKAAKVLTADRDGFSLNAAVSQMHE
jgi:hypothetical protein